jgi:hypothetical protein
MNRSTTFGHRLSRRLWGKLARTLSLPVITALIGLGAAAAPAQADAGSYCLGASLTYGQSCYSSWESDVKRVDGNSNYSYTWVWVYNQANGGEANSGQCTYAAGCLAGTIVSSAGHGYEEIVHYETFGPNPDSFYGGWFSS